MRQISYMIGYKPNGSSTFTPVGDDVVAKYTDNHANFIANKFIAEDICTILKAREDGNDYQIFEFREVGYTVSCGGGRID